jgi:hypothetical protein
MIGHSSDNDPPGVNVTDRRRPLCPVRRRPFRSGVTLVELAMSSAVAVILVLTVGILLKGSSQAWLQTYQSIHGTANENAVAITATFGSIGRRSNRASYVLYQISQGAFTPVVPDATHPDTVLFGNAVEFRYWDVPLDASDSHGLMDATKLATAYALFYLDGSQLKVDYGPYPPGAIAGSGARNTTGVTTALLAQNVSAACPSGVFSHSTVAAKGQGSVRLSLILTDPQSGKTVPVMTTALMRNIWPK